MLTTCCSGWTTHENVLRREDWNFCWSSTINIIVVYILAEIGLPSPDTRNIQWEVKLIPCQERQEVKCAPPTHSMGLLLIIR